MAAALAWFPFYVDAFENDEAVRLMTHEEVGIFLRLMCWQWREGSIPNDPRRLAKILRAPTAAVRTVTTRCFRDDGSHVGRLINPKMAEIRAHQLDKAGKASNAARGWKSTEDRYLYAAEAAIERRANDGQLRVEKHIKIGWSRNPKARISAIGREARQRLILLGMRVATIALERKAHVDLALHRESGEWFRDVPAVRQWLDTNGVTSNTGGNTAGSDGGIADGTTAVRSRIRSEIETSLSARAERRESKAPA
jgi:uncharacterized protein YdaU (DUF1376 family)